MIASRVNTMMPLLSTGVYAEVAVLTGLGVRAVFFTLVFLVVAIGTPYLVTEMVLVCSAEGALTVTRLLASFTTLYPVPLVAHTEAVPHCGSLGSETRYLPLVVRTVKSTRLVHGDAPVAQISVAVVVIPVGNAPLLSSAYW